MVCLIHMHTLFSYYDYCRKVMCKKTDWKHRAIDRTGRVHITARCVNSFSGF